MISELWLHSDHNSEITPGKLDWPRSGVGVRELSFERLEARGCGLVAVEGQRPVPPARAPSVLGFRPAEVPRLVGTGPASQHAAMVLAEAGLEGAGPFVVLVDERREGEFHPQRRVRDVGAEPLSSGSEVGVLLGVPFGALVPG